jgi:hypothetical protein
MLPTRLSACCPICVGTYFFLDDENPTKLCELQPICLSDLRDEHALFVAQTIHLSTIVTIYSEAPGDKAFGSSGNVELKPGNVQCARDVIDIAVNDCLLDEQVWVLVIDISLGHDRVIDKASMYKFDNAEKDGKVPCLLRSAARKRDLTHFWSRWQTSAIFCNWLSSRDACPTFERECQPVTALKQAINDLFHHSFEASNDPVSSPELALILLGWAYRAPVAKPSFAGVHRLCYIIRQDRRRIVLWREVHICWCEWWAA